MDENNKREKWKIVNLLSSPLPPVINFQSALNLSNWSNQIGANSENSFRREKVHDDSSCNNHS